ncbi:MAG: signal peptidase I, partial [Desulfurococcaceae archaeon]
MSGGKMIRLAVVAGATLLVVLSSLMFLAEIPLAVVKGESMFPLLREGDLVIIVRVKPEDIGVGDIIVFRTPNGRLVVHRVIDVVEVDGRKYYVTMGDNNRVRDVYYPVGVPYDRVIGKL